MTIITDLLIIDHLISVFVTLPYLPLVFRHLTTYHTLSKILTSTIYYPMLCLKLLGEWQTV